MDAITSTSRANVEQVTILLKTILEAGGPAVIALLLGACAYLGWEKYLLVRQCERTIKELTDRYNSHLDKSHEGFMELVEKYQEGQLDVVQAMNEIKVLVATIGAKLDH